MLPDPDHEAQRDFDLRLHAALRQEASRYEMRATSDRIQVEMARVDWRSPARWPTWWPIAALPFLLAALVAAVFIFLPAPVAPPAAKQTPAPTASPAVVVAGPISADVPTTLDECHITPASAHLAFAGWTTTDALRLAQGIPARGQPVYALVTQGVAGWIGSGATGDGPQFQGRSERMACLFDPSTARLSIVGVPDSWIPPEVADGCPVATVHDYGGYREIGGPDVWLTLPHGIGVMANGATARLSFRIAGTVGPDDRVSAWAEPLANGGRIDGAVEAIQTPVITSPSPGSHFYFVTIPFSAPGCWVVNVAVNGTVAGSTVLPVGVVVARAPAPIQPARP